jgi:hypothetical protein
MNLFLKYLNVFNIFFCLPVHPIHNLTKQTNTCGKQQGMMGNICEDLFRPSTT